MYYISSEIAQYSIPQDSFRYIAHHGIKGQKWGVRRFQNLDRTWTEAGKERYGSHSDGRKVYSAFSKKWDGTLSQDIVHALQSKKNQAIFYTGCVQRDQNGNIIKSSTAFANEYASRNRGVTMGTLLANAAKSLPEWDFNDADSIHSWEGASKAYAQQASGVVRVVAKYPLRKGNIFENVELPTLKKNLNVTRIIMIDPDTNKKTVIFRR